MSEHSGSGLPPPPSTSLPAKKRRRPALACEQCRRRKIKCDRNIPCNHCLKSKISTCSYVPTHIPASWAKRGKDPSQRKELSSTHKENPQAFILPASNKEKGTPPSSEYIHPHAQQWLHSVHGSTRSSSVSASLGGSVSKASPDDVDWLQARVHHLEEKLSKVDVTSGDEDDYYEKSPGGTESTAPIKGTVSKTRYFGRSHWMNGTALLPLEMKLLTRVEFEKGPLSSQLAKCKALGRTIKEHRLGPLSSISLCQTIPDRLLADTLVNAYLRTFEGVLRILHVPTFMAEYERYWQHPSAASDFFKIQLQLVMALGAPFYDELFTLRSKSTQWIYEAQMWLMLPPEKSRMTIAGIQIMCLLSLARSVCAVGHDLVWVTTGGLLRKAMFMGLHRDPRRLADMTTYRAEMRRRLWATILELNLQSSFDAGGPPLVSPRDHDVLPPANLDDCELDDRPDHERPDMRPSDPKVVTQMSIPIELYKTLPLRLEVLRHANDFRAEDSYDDTLRYNSELTKYCRSLSQSLVIFLKNEQKKPMPKVTEFHASMAELLLYRCFHTLHQPIISRSLYDPKFYFSRKMYLDGALKITHICGLSGRQRTQDSTTSSPETPDQQSDFERLLTNASGVFRNIPVQSQPALVLELLSNRSDRSPLGLGYLPAVHDYDLHATLNAFNVWALKRVRSGETNIKGHVYNASCSRHIAAVDAGLDEAGIESEILKGAEESAAQCYEALKDLAQREGLIGTGEEPAEVMTGSGEAVVERFGMGMNADIGMDFGMDDWAWDEMSGLLWGSPRPFDDVHPPIFG